MTDLVFRQAAHSDLSTIVELLADDPLGQTREQFAKEASKEYEHAFNLITCDPNAYLILAEEHYCVVGVAQLNIIQYLTFQGGKRAQIEGVRVRKQHQHRGIGKRLFQHLFQLGKQHGCHMAQLTTNNDRQEAHVFYQKIGFKHTHSGFKYYL